jgi:nucleotide-binding universal stress UspA family protein
MFKNLVVALDGSSCAEHAFAVALALAKAKFKSALLVRGAEDPSRSYIELDGTYVPPLGTIGEVFDAAIGHQIPQSSAREFLRDLKRTIEAKRSLGAFRSE